MHISLRHLALCLVFGACLLQARGASAAYRAYMATAPTVYFEYVSIPQNSWVTFETNTLTAGADPVMYLLRDDGGGNFVQVAYSDDFAPPNLNSTITFQNTSANTNYVLFIRGYSSATVGTCDLKKNGTLHHALTPINGWFTPSSLMTFSVGNEVRTAHVSGGSVAPMIVKFSSVYAISGLAIGNSAGGGAKLIANGSESHFLMGTPQVMDGGTYTPLRAGAAGIMVNDIAADTDGDGVGDLLEGTLGTCSTTTGCGYNAVHGRDTDRDGLSDGEEIWGLVGSLAGSSDDIALPRWGASPRKKDVFLELDWLTTLESPVSGTNPFQWMRNNPGTIATGTLEDWVDLARAPFLAAPSAHVRNPDGSNGVALHLDLGVQPLVLSNESKFGDWPTLAARGVVPDFIMYFTGTINGQVTVSINGVPWSFDATGLTPDQIGAVVALGVASMGQPVYLKSFSVDSQGFPTVVIEAGTAGQHFTRSLSVPVGFESAVTIKTEDNGSYRNQYETDPEQVDASRIGVVRYGVILNLFNGGGQASGPKFVAGLPQWASMHELGHSLGLAHNGHSAWGNGDFECMPHYLSMMRYGGGPYQFSNVASTVAVNPAATSEYQTLGAAFDHSAFLVSPYLYQAPTDYSNVDWDRDGINASNGTTVRSFAASIPGGSCKAYSQGQTALASETVADTPDLVRHGTRLYAIWVSGSSIKYRSAILGTQGNKSCTGSADPTTGSPCLTWNTVQTLANSQSYKGITAYSYGGSLIVATRLDDGSLQVRHCSADASGILTMVSAIALLNTTPELKAGATPELVERHQSVTTRILGLHYVGQDGKYRAFGWTGAVWQYEGAMLDSAGNPIAGGTGAAAMGLAAKAWPDSAVTGWNANEKKTLAVLPSATGVMKVYGLDYTTNKWFDLAVPLGGGMTTARPFLEYRTVRTTAGTPDASFRGHFMIGWGDYGGPVDGIRARFRLSTPVSRTSPPWTGTTGALGVTPLSDYLQNTWATTQTGASGVLFSDSTIDNVFGLIPLATGAPTLYFYPHADGSPNHNLNVYSDFRVMEDYICATLGASRAFPCGTINVLD